MDNSKDSRTELSRFRDPFFMGKDRNLKSSLEPHRLIHLETGIPDTNIWALRKKLEKISTKGDLGQEGELQICFVLALDLPLADPGLKDEEWWVGGGAGRQLFRRRSQYYLRLQTNTAVGHGEGQSVTLWMVMNHSYKELRDKSLCPWRFKEERVWKPSVRSG